MDKLLHVYAQDGPHDSVGISATPAALQALADFILATLRGDGDGTMRGFFTGDGEEFRVAIDVATEDEIGTYRLPYRDEAW